MNNEQIRFMYEKYMDIVKLEVEEFGCRPTEVRHLIGRLGEFFCAIHVNGKLAHEANQHGFDVIAENGRRISVKTTAQKSGFITINPNTINKVDDLMLIQFIDSRLEVVFHGPIQKAVDVSRTWEGKFEFDISKAKKLT
ncbi:MAG TPA: hypothetical protein PLW03_04925 [Methylotenera sp.]|nr:hypothetical protein [Methylotenera sp.]